VDTALFKQLLFEGESSTLDFKQQQYPFTKASKDERFELLKDILGFANAVRRTDAYILIGVEDVPGGRGNVLGIAAAEHLQDHSLQQFVNNLTNRPVRFHYEAFGFEGKQVGIIRVEQQQARPLFLKHDYGKLRRNEIYVRRGSSTDWTKPAGPDEIAMMGQGSATQLAELKVEFAEVDRDLSLGDAIALSVENCGMPSKASIPTVKGNPWGPASYANRYFYREFADYEFCRRLAAPVRLVIRNTGEVAADSVRVELTTGVEEGVVVCKYLPQKPSPSVFDAGLGSVRGHSFQRTAGDVSIDKNAERFLVAIECGDLQPARQVRSEVFYAGRFTNGDVAFKGRVYAANLTHPVDLALVISFTVSHREMSFGELRTIADG
jgi:Putative DNA-binding domain